MSKEGKIYKIVNTVDDMVYIGSTTRALCQRMCAHRGMAQYENRKKTKLYQHMNNIGIEKFKILLVRSFVFESKHHLEHEEFKEIAMIPNNHLLNDIVVYRQLTDEAKQKMSGINNSRWKYGSIWKRKAKDSNGYHVENWTFCYTQLDTKKKKAFTFSIKKYGEETALQMAKDKRKEIFPEAPENISE